MKLTRGAHILYLDASFGTGTPEWFKVGSDIDDLSIELNPDVSVNKNILDETSVLHNGYEPSADITPYYANPDDSIYPKLRNIAMNRLKGGDCKTSALEVIVEDTDDTAHMAWKQDVVVAVSSYGGDTSGFQIAYSINYEGERTQGTVTLVEKVPTFTAGSTYSGF